MTPHCGNCADAADRILRTCEPRPHEDGAIHFAAAAGMAYAIADAVEHGNAGPYCADSAAWWRNVARWLMRRSVEYSDQDAWRWRFDAAHDEAARPDLRLVRSN